MPETDTDVSLFTNDADLNVWEPGPVFSSHSHTSNRYNEKIYTSRLKKTRITSYKHSDNSFDNTVTLTDSQNENKYIEVERK